MATNAVSLNLPSHLSRRLATLGAWSGVLAPGALLLATLAASAIAAHYSHFDDSICQLGAQHRPHAWIISLGFVVYAALVVVLAKQVGQTLQSRWGSTAAKALLLHAAYAVLLAFVQASPGGGVESNTEGAVHIFLARGAMAFIWLAMLASAKHYSHIGSDGFSRYSIVALSLGLTLGLAYIAQVAVSVDGVLERIMLLLAAGWLVALSLRLRRDTPTARP